MIKKAKPKRGVYFITPKILQFENKLIDDEDMMHLFFGVIKLMKKSIEFELENKYLNKIKRLESLLQMYNKN